MPIWSLTQERVDKLKAQMLAKKEEQTALELLSEKDLWCQDLDAFVNEWEVQLQEEADYQKGIRNTKRRISSKIGAGKAVGKSKKTDDDYAPKAAKTAKPEPKIIKVEPKKSSDAFLKMFNKQARPTKPGFGKDGVSEDEEVNGGAAMGSSDDDFDALVAVKPSRSASQTSRAPSEQPAGDRRAKRAAAAAPKKWVIDDDEESDSDDDKLLGNIGDMVKGIGEGAAPVDNGNGRVSLFAMNRPESSHGRSTSNDLPKLKSKPSKSFDISDGDETNYEMLARSSPQKPPPTAKDNLDSFLSMDEDDDILPLPKKVTKAPAAKPAPKPRAKPISVAKPAPVVKKAPAAKPKPVALSPAAKAYAAKQKKSALTKNVFSEDEEEKEETEDDEDESLPPQPAARDRGRPARAAAVAKKPAAPISIDSSDDDDMDVDDVDESTMIEEEPSDDFDESE
jgi:DNA topoisomerase-2